MKNYYIEFFTTKEREYRFDFFQHGNERFFIEVTVLGRRTGDEPKLTVAFDSLPADVASWKQSRREKIRNLFLSNLENNCRNGLTTPEQIALLREIDWDNIEWYEFIGVFIHPVVGCGIRNYRINSDEIPAKEPDNETLNQIRIGGEIFDGTKCSFYYGTSSPFSKLREWKNETSETWDDFLAKSGIFRSLDRFLEFILHRYLSYNGIGKKTEKLSLIYQRKKVKEQCEVFKRYSTGLTLTTLLMTVRSIVDAKQKALLDTMTANDFLPQKIPAAEKALIRKAWTEMQQTIRSKESQCPYNDLTEFIASENVDEVNELLHKIKAESGLCGERLFRRCLYVDIFFLVCYDEKYHLPDESLSDADWAATDIFQGTVFAGKLQLTLEQLNELVGLFDRIEDLLEQLLDTIRQGKH